MKKAGDSLSQWLGMLLVATLILPGMGWAAENQPPSATAKTATFNEDTKATITLSGKDPERKTLGYVLASQPSHGTVSLKGNKVTYTPAPNYFGADSFTYLVNDGVLDSAPAMVSLTIRAVNDKPVADAASFVAVKDTASEFTLSGSDIEDGKTLVFQPGARSKKGGAVRLKQGNVVTYTPKKGFVGADSFTFTVKDSGRAVSVAATVKVDVKASKPNSPPIANAGSDQTVVEKVSINLDGSSSSDNDGSIASYAWAQVSGDAVTLTGADTATPSFTAPVVNNTEGSKVLTFGLRVTDKEGASSADTVIITVNAVNENPMADAGADQEVDEKSSVSLSGSATDPDGDTTTYNWVQTDSSGLSVTLTGADTATPAFTAPVVLNADGSKVLVFKLTVTDNKGASAEDSVSVTVNAVNAAPVATPQLLEVDEDNVLQITLSGVDADGDNLSFSVSKQPVNGTLVGAAPNLTYTPHENFNGTDSFVFMVHDGTVGSSEVTSHITIKPVNDAPTANAGVDQTVNEKVAVILDGSVSSDPDGTIASYAWVQTAGATVALSGANTAKPTFTAPEVVADETLTFELTVTDNHGATAKDSVSVVVKNISITPNDELVLAMGGSHSCALVNGGVQCWGWNGRGQLGDGTVAERHSPVQAIAPSSDVSAVSAGLNHTCAVIKGGVWCWGSNLEGQLGDGTATDRLAPVQVIAPGSGVVAIDTGMDHTCVVINGGVKCWGNNAYGQLGDGTATDRNIPVQAMASSSGVTAVTTGDYHTCAIVHGGVKCWGDNYHGQLGDGTNIDHYSPVQAIASNSGVLSIDSGWFQTCALLNGGVQCWGDNRLGQLGDGSTIERHSPVQTIAENSDVTAITVGSTYVCAVVSTGVRCWGGT